MVKNADSQLNSLSFNLAWKMTSYKASVLQFPPL